MKGRYTPVRADRIQRPGVITSQIIQHVLEDDVVIADLTDHNPNVFYELALRHFARKPFVQLIDPSQSIPFDIHGVRTIHVDYHDLDSVADARLELIANLDSIEANPDDVDTPVSLAVDIQRYRDSENPADRSNAAVLEAVAGLSREINLLRRRNQFEVSRIGRSFNMPPRSVMVGFDDGSVGPLSEQPDPVVQVFDARISAPTTDEPDGAPQ